MIVRCTARLLEFLGRDELSDAPPGPEDWYANLVWIDRRKCLLAVHAETLFAVFIADVRKPQLDQFGRFISAAVVTSLGDEGLPPDRLGPIDPAQVSLAKTSSRSVLGFMNDMTKMARHLSQRAGGLACLDTDDLNRFLRRTPYNRNGYIRPIEAAQRRPDHQ